LARNELGSRPDSLKQEMEEGAMKKGEIRETKKVKYEKPILTKFRKLTDVLANGSKQPG